jgi:uncharacterized protein (TIGR00730 family)
MDIQNIGNKDELEKERKDPHKPTRNTWHEHLPHKTLTLSDLDDEMQKRIKHINQEFVNGLGFIRNSKKSVTIFGSARLGEDNPHYQKARRLGRLISEAGFDIITGGGPGIMEAANRGAFESECCGASLGMNIELPMEQVLNPYVEDYVNFYYFFTRKVSLAFSAEAYIYFPGGFGTLDELFEILTLVQTKKIEPVPILLVGEDFWKPIHDLIQDHLLHDFETISKPDLNCYTITDDEDKILEIVKNAPLRDS